jgi:spermidine synthase
MSTLKKILSHIWDIPIEKASSKHNPYLEVVWSQGRKMLNTKEANFSFGNGFKVFDKATSEIKAEIKEAKSVLILGFGCGSIMHLLEKNFGYHLKIDGVEYDQAIIDLFYKHFAEDYMSKPTIAVEDANDFVLNCKNQYDIVFVDLFQELDNVPFVFNKVFLEGLKRIGTNGCLVFNLTARSEQDRTNISNLLIDLSNDFKNVNNISFQDINWIIIAK